MSENSIGVLTLTAIAAAPVAQYQAIGFDGAPAGADQRVKGFAETAAETGRAFAVRTLGTGIARAGAAVAIGDPLTTDGAGALVPVTGSEVIVADALEAAEAGEPFEVLLAR
ncbi:MAG: hypothetical protein ACPG06_09535 [Alphaproteobacteria bacterium]